MANLYLNFRKLLKSLVFLLKSLRNRTQHDSLKSNIPGSSKSPPRNRMKASSDSSAASSVRAHPDLTAVVEVIQDKFYFATLVPGRLQPKSIPGLYLFNTDDHLTYSNFYDDFGPLNLACLYKYCRGVNDILSNPEFGRVVHVTSPRAEKRANAVYLVAAYSVLYLNKSPDEVYESFTTGLGLPLRPFQDASIGVSPYHITLIDCLNALSKAATFGFFNFDDFDLREYEKYGKLRNGDLNWIVPRKFLAFIGPSTEAETEYHYPEKYLNYFMKNEVAAVIRLNKKNYDSSRFTRAGILHYDMYFPDGSAPPLRILRRFLVVAEGTRGALAVHCKAGLGRTGSLIAAYAMKHYDLGACEAVGWLRICRPGSVIGQQQAWLEAMEPSLRREGRRFRLEHRGDEELILRHERGIYSLAAKLNRRSPGAGGLGGEWSSAELGSSDAGCASARGPANPAKTSALRKSQDEDEAARAGKEITQGDKLNGIKIKRNY